MSAPLNREVVRRIATLARLQLDDATVERYRSELASVLEHMETLARIDVEGVEPMAHPRLMPHPLAEDAEAASLPFEDLARNAPACDGRFLVVPKVLDEGGSQA